MAYNYEEALRAGASEDQVLEYLTKSRKYDIDGALKAGANKRQIIEHLAKTPAPSEDEMGLGSALVKGVLNTPKSGVKAIKDTYSAVANPIQTLKGLGSLALGGVSKLVPGKQESEQTFDAVIDDFKNAYGGWDKIKNTIANDPVRVLTDFATVLSGGGAAVSKIGTAGKIGSVAKAGKLAQKVGDAIDPVNVAMKGAGAAVNSVVAPVAREFAGFSSRQGGTAVSEAVDAASKAPTEYYDALRGKTDIIEIKNRVDKKLTPIRQSLRTVWDEGMGPIKDNVVENTKPILDKLSEEMERYSLKLDPKTRELDFSESILKNDKLQETKVQNALDDILTTVQNPTVKNMDNLKQRLGLLAEDTPLAKAMLNSVQGAVRETLEAVDGYADLQTKYGNVKKLLEEVDEGLATGGKTETILKKLVGVFRTSNLDFRKKLIDALDNKSGGVPITAELAGYVFKEKVPQGLAGTYAVAAGGAGFLNPWIWAFLPTTSPRLVGEVLGAIGYTKGKITNVVDSVRRARIKAGKSTEKFYKEMGFSDEFSKDMSEYIKNGTLSDKLKYIYEAGMPARVSDEEQSSPEISNK